MDNTNEHKCVDPNELLVRTKNNVEKFGLQVIMVNATDYLPSFAYSIGLYKPYNHPEIICFGLPNDLGHNIINDVAELIKKGEQIKPSKIMTTSLKTAKPNF